MDEIVRRAERFFWTTARVLEQRRFAFLFADGSAEAVLEALRPYRNPDGGYGWALEPDGRGPTSQPVHADFALRVLDEVGAVAGAVEAGFCDGLAPLTAADGGLVIVHPAIAPHPHPPWWGIPERFEGSLIPTAGIAGLLHRHGVRHPWLDAATAFCWDRISSLGATHPWEVVACVDFLDGVPDRERARAVAARLGAKVRAESLVVVDRDAPATPPPGYAPGEFHYPDDYAPRPDSVAREWFSDTEIAASLDALAAEQREDGGWPVRWGRWNPAAEIEFRPEVSLRALLRLRAYGR